jgi:hypothetical protein
MYVWLLNGTSALQVFACMGSQRHFQHPTANGAVLDKNGRMDDK